MFLSKLKNLIPSLFLITIFSVITSPAYAGKQSNLQDEQRLAICSAISEGEQKKHYYKTLIAKLKETQTGPLIEELTSKKIAALEANFKDYSSESKQDLVQKLCIPEKVELSDDFKGLTLNQLPQGLQQKITSIAKCAILSNGYNLTEQAQKLTAANTLIIVAAGLNGKKTALQQLGHLHQTIGLELKKLSEAELKAQFTTSCEQVKNLKNKP